MKYLRLHKLIWGLLVLISLIFEIVLTGIFYVLYLLWNLRWYKGNLWYDFHDYDSDWSGRHIQDRTPWQTFVRRYNLFNSID